MRHIRVLPNMLVNPDSFESISYGVTLGGNPEVLFVRPGRREPGREPDSLRVVGPDAERVWRRLTDAEDELERLTGVLDEIERRQIRVMRMLGHLEGPAGSHAGAATGEGIGGRR